MLSSTDPSTTASLATFEVLENSAAAASSTLQQSSIVPSAVGQHAPRSPSAAHWECASHDCGPAFGSNQSTSPQAGRADHTSHRANGFVSGSTKETES